MILDYWSTGYWPLGYWGTGYWQYIPIPLTISGEMYYIPEWEEMDDEDVLALWWVIR